MMPHPLPPSPWEFEPAAWPDDDCVAGGADLDPSTVIEAYRHGAFPMPHGDQLLWWSPMMRGVLRPDDLHVSRSLRRSLPRFTMTVDESFAEVMQACADPSRPGAWIDANIRAAYEHLHELGWAHSVETRDAEGRLVGGLYGLAIGDLFAGESMFHHVTDASKAALVELAHRWNHGLIDVQWSTPHLASLGVAEMPRADYLRTIADLVDEPPRNVW